VGELFLVGIEVTIKVELKGLTHMFCLLMSYYKVYKKRCCFLDFTLKIMSHLGGVHRSLIVKAKCKIK